MKFYHGTTTSVLASILENGLTPRPSFDNGARTATYLSNDEYTADMYAVLACDRRGGKAVVIEIDSSLLVASAFEPDDYDLQNLIDDYHDPERTDNIGPNTGHEMDERLAHYRTWKDVPASLSLELSQQIAYTLPIEVQAFLNLEELRRLQQRNSAMTVSTLSFA
jgi:hypothetical protein